MAIDQIQDSSVSATTIAKLTPTPSTRNGRENTENSVPLKKEPEAAQRERPLSGIDSIAVQQEFPPNTRLHLDEVNNRIVAQVLDDNNEVVRQIPSQELLDISARFNRLQGLLFDEKR